MADNKKAKYKLVGFTPYKSGKGKVLFLNRYGSENVVGVACDIEFLNGKNHAKVTEEWLGREIDLHKGSKIAEDGTKEYYVYDVDIK